MFKGHVLHELFTVFAFAIGITCVLVGNRDLVVGRRWEQ